MRGKVTITFSGSPTTRITPAHAGKRLRFDFCRRCARDHPRPCGEKGAKSSRGWWMRGSPPPMRGKGTATGFKSISGRITPAHAGKRRCYMGYCVTIEDHPRPCGEKPSQSVSSYHLPGSPPPMRGKAAVMYACACYGGITPAHAGKRAAVGHRSGAHRDHPRPCGEKYIKISTKISAKGSPPPMRGKDAQPISSPSSFRITPAHAGKS